MFKRIESTKSNFDILGITKAIEFSVKGYYCVF